MSLLRWLHVAALGSASYMTAVQHSQMTKLASWRASLDQLG